MYMFLLVIHIIASLFLVFIILIQSSKGEGLSDVFGGGSSQTTIFGTRTGNFLTKATTASAIIFMITSLSLAFISRRKAGSVVQKELFKQQVTEKVQAIIQDKVKKTTDTAEQKDKQTTKPEVLGTSVKQPEPQEKSNPVEK